MNSSARLSWRLFESDHSFWNRTWVQWAFTGFIWSLVVMVSFAQSLYFRAFGKSVVGLFEDFMFQATYYYPWWLLSPLMLYWVRRFPLNRSGMNIGIHVGLSLIVGYIERAFTFVLMIGLFDKWHLMTSEISTVKIVGGGVDSILMYWTLTVIYSGIDYYQQFRRQKILSAEMETQLQRAKLDALRMQLHPHFLFNTLHAIASLMEEDVKAAQRMIARLSELLRHALDYGTSPTVPLRDEIDFLKKYLEIEQIRFHDRLSVRYEVAKKVINYSVPYFILQPLVENAIKHGVSKKTGTGMVTISAAQSDGSLILRICDDGPGTLDVRRGIGLTNTEERLRHHFGNDFKFTTGNLASGFCAEIEIPVVDPGAGT